MYVQADIASLELPQLNQWYADYVRNMSIDDLRIVESDEALPLEVRASTKMVGARELYMKLKQ